MTNIEKMNSTGASLRLNGIMACIDSGKASKEEVEILKSLKKDKVILAGRPLSAYAYAALHLLGIEEYQGSNNDVKDFINSIKK